MSYFTELFVDPSFMGALLGAIITGFIALSLFFFQMKNEKKRKYEHYNKVYVEMKKNLEFASDGIMMFEGFVYGLPDDDSGLMICQSAFTVVLEELENVKREDIPYEVFNVFVKVKTSLRSIKMCSNIYLDNKDLGFMKERFINDVKEFRENNEKYNSHFSIK